MEKRTRRGNPGCQGGWSWQYQVWLRWQLWGAVWAACRQPVLRKPADEMRLTRGSVPSNLRALSNTSRMCLPAVHSSPNANKIFREGIVKRNHVWRRQRAVANPRIAHYRPGREQSNQGADGQGRQ